MPNAPPKYDGQWLSEILAGLMGRIDERGMPVPPETAYTVVNYTESRSLNASTATVSDVADVVCTLIADLKQMKVLR